MGSGVFASFAMDMILKSLLGVVADACVEAVILTEEDIDVPRRNRSVLRLTLFAQECVHDVHLLRGQELNLVCEIMSLTCYRTLPRALIGAYVTRYTR